MRTAAVAFAMLLAGLTAPGLARAQTTNVFNRTGSGARAAGMANAFIAVSDDGTAASWNPAGLGQLRNIEMSVVTTVTTRSLSADGVRTLDGLSAYAPAKSHYGTAYLDFASLALPFKVAGRPVTVQGAWRSLYNLDYHEAVPVARLPLTPEAPPGMLIEGNTDSSGSIDQFSLAAAVKVTSRFAIGASLNVWDGHWTEGAASAETTPSSGLPPVYSSYNQTTDMDGHSYGIGLLFTYPKVNVGLVYQFPLDGDFGTANVHRDSTNAVPQTEIVDARLRLPRSLGGGVAWHPAARWTVAADLTWDEWTDSLVIVDGQPPINLFDGLPTTLSATRDTLSANAGAELLLQGEGFVVPVRFGAAWEPQGPRDFYTRDNVNFTMLAAGAGYNTNWLKFDVAVNYRWSRFQDTAVFVVREYDDLVPNAVGERAVREWRLKFSVILRATDSEKLSGVFKKIFGG